MTPQALPLRDIQLPDPISWWPPAPGWWLLSVLGLVLALTAAVAWSRRRRKRQLYREAMHELERIHRETWRASEDPTILVREMSQLLRRVALSVYPRGQVAGLVGEDWLRFLDQALHDTPCANAFTEGAGRILVSAPYRPRAQADAGELVRLCRSWIKAVAEAGHPPAGEKP